MWAAGGFRRCAYLLLESLLHRRAARPRRAAHVQSIPPTWFRPFGSPKSWKSPLDLKKKHGPMAHYLSTPTCSACPPQRNRTLPASRPIDDGRRRHPIASARPDIWKRVQCSRAIKHRVISSLRLTRTRGGRGRGWWETSPHVCDFDWEGLGVSANYIGGYRMIISVNSTYGKAIKSNNGWPCLDMSSSRHPNWVR